MTDVVEVMARGICLAQDEDPDASREEHPNWRGWHQYAGAARAALAALNEAGYVVVHKRDYVDKAEAWDALYRPAAQPAPK